MNSVCFNVYRVAERYVATKFSIETNGELIALCARCNTRLMSKLASPPSSLPTNSEFRGYLKDWSVLTSRHPAQTRQILRKLLPSRIRLSHDDDGIYRFSGEAAVGRMISGMLGDHQGKRSGVPNENRHTREHPPRRYIPSQLTCWWRPHELSPRPPRPSV